MTKMSRREFEAKRFTSKADEWGTPRSLFQELDREFSFDLDPCGDRSRLLRDDLETWTKEDDGLSKSWAGRRVFVNPPYGAIKEWVRKCYLESSEAEVIVLLIFARTDTRYFHDFIYPAASIRFIKGRLRFSNLNKPDAPQLPATFPSMLCIYRRKEVIAYG